MEYIALDVHKKYTWARVENTEGEKLYESRLQHAHGSIKNFIYRWERQSPVVVETVGNWYWIVVVVEEASDAFGKKGRAIVEGILVKLPPYTEQAVRRVLGQFDHVNENLKVIEV